MLLLVSAIVVMALVMAGMAIGVMMGRKPLKGSCGGVAAALGEENYTCEICGGDPNKCDESDSDSNKLVKTKNATSTASLGYNAAP